MTQAWPTAQDLAGMPGMPGTRRGVLKRAVKECWPTQTEAVRGGQLTRYCIDALPEETRMALALRNVAAQAGDAANDAPAMPVGLTRAGSAGDALRGLRQADERTGGTASVANVTGERAAARDDKMRVLVAFQRFHDTFGGALCPALMAFVSEWNAGRIEVKESARKRWPAFRRWHTVRDWWQALTREGGAGLTRPASPRAGRSEVLEGALGQFVLATLMEKPHLGGKQIHRLADKAIAAGLLQTGDLPSLRAFQYAISGWKQKNKQLFTAITNPDKWRNQYMSAAGSRSEGIELNDLWEMDGTKTDLLLSDGRRWSLTGVIDVGTRRMMLRLSPTARAAVVMGLTRRAMSEWGIPKRLKTDNGSDYTADQYELGLTQLDPEMHVLCDPFQPQQKPHIERGLGTLLHDLFELLPGYIGHSVAERKDIEARRSFAERLMRGSPDGGPVELRLSPEKLQLILDNWLADYHAREHGGLGNKSPDQVVAEWSGTVYRADERALDIFLAPASKSGTVTVTKKGIKLDHGWFNCAEIGGLEGQQVQAKQTEGDQGICYVFDLAGRYVGTAIDHARKGVSAAEVAAQRREHQKKFIAQQKAELKAHVRAVKPQQLVMEILTRKRDEAIDAADNVTRIKREAVHTSEAIESLAAAAEQQAAPQISPAAAQTLALIEQGAGPKGQLLELKSPDQRYSKFVRLQARIDAGTEPIEPRDLAWFERYATSSERRALDRIHQGSDPLAAEAGG